MVDVMFKVFLLMFGNIFQRIYFLHSFVDDSIKLCYLIFYLLDFGVGDFDFFSGVEFEKSTLIHVNLSMSVL